MFEKAQKTPIGLVTNHDGRQPPAFLSTAERRKAYPAFSKRRVFIQKAEHVSAICVGSLYRAKESQYRRFHSLASERICAPQHYIADSVVRRMSATRQTGRVCACPHTGVITTTTTLTGGYVRPSVARAQVKGSVTLLQGLQTASLAILIVILATLIIMLCALGLYTMRKRHRKRHRKRSSSFSAAQEQPHTNSAISLVTRRS